jgi:alkylation response protein AidB-like acyl-CoA dehydrogenase
MDFKLTEEHQMIQQAARDFAQTELLPGVIERDEHSKFPTEQVKMMGELGFMGMMVDPKYGGAAGCDFCDRRWIPQDCDCRSA